MDKFLKKYYKQLHFNSMPADVRARFFDWVRNDTLTDDMRNWVRDYLEHDPNTNQLQVDARGNYILKALPNPTPNSNDLSEDDARKLFVAFQQAFAGMAGDLSSFRDTDHQSSAFVNRYFGVGKLFKTSPATQACANGIAAIQQLLTQHPNLKDYIVANTQNAEGKAVFESKNKLDELLTKCNNGEFNTDNSVQKKIQSVAKTLAGVVGWYSSIDQNSAEYQAINNIKDDINNVASESAFAMDPARIDPAQLAAFRTTYAGATYDKENQTGLLQTLYYNKTIRDRFAKYDNGAITGPINKAEEGVNWQDKSKNNYVDPKIKDVLTPLQRIQEWTTDVYSDTLKKYEELRGGHKFFSQEAKDICSAIDKIKDKVKPVDGLDKLLDRKSDIEKKLNNPVARQHFQWFTETMEPIAAKMPQAVKGAWKDAKQMKAIIDQIILKATDPQNADPHAMEKAKTAMEIMTVMKYGMMTSKVMDAIKNDKELFSFFSNKDLSWNKNEGIQFITNALDKSVRLAFLGVGYGITIVKNEIKLSGRKYKDRDNQNGALARRFNQENTTKQQALRVQNTLDTASINQRQQDLQRLNTGQHAVNANNLNTQTANLQTLQQRMQAADAIRQANRAGYDTYNTNQQLVNQDIAAHTELTNLVTQQNNLRNQITTTRNRLQNSATYANMPASAANALAMTIQQDLIELERQEQEITQQCTNRQNALNDPNYIQNINNARAAMNASQGAYNAYSQADQNYNNYKSSADTLNARIEEFNNATREIQELTRAVNERTNALQNWPQANLNKIIELENHWNFLQDKTTTWNLSQKRAQKRFDRNNQKQIDLQRYISQRGLAA